jgi:hypothetical protein
MIRRSTARTAVRATRVAIHTKGDKFNDDLRQARFGAVTARRSVGHGDARLSEVSSAARGDHRPREALADIPC